jgi:hypothetical protein
MQTNLVFFGLHFVIAKRETMALNYCAIIDRQIVYANSLLASLNVRQELQELRWKSENSAHARHINRSDLTGSSLYSESFMQSTELYVSPSICLF